MKNNTYDDLPTSDPLLQPFIHLPPELLVPREDVAPERAHDLLPVALLDLVLQELRGARVSRDERAPVRERVVCQPLRLRRRDGVVCVDDLLPSGDLLNLV